MQLAVLFQSQQPQACPLVAWLWLQRGRSAPAPSAAGLLAERGAEDILLSPATGCETPRENSQAKEGPGIGLARSPPTRQDREVRLGLVRPLWPMGGFRNRNVGVAFLVSTPGVPQTHRMKYTRLAPPARPAEWALPLIPTPGWKAPSMCLILC